MQSTFFHEEQQFRQPWIWLGISASLLGLLPFWYGLHQQLVEGVPWGDNPTSDELLLLITVAMTLLIVGILFLFLKSRLIVTVGSEGIEYRFFPFHRKTHKILWSEIAKAYVRTYRPIVEYGGWGIRYGLKGKAYNVSGNQGLQLELKDGKRILFGTQQPQQLEMVIKHSLEAKPVLRTP